MTTAHLDPITFEGPHGPVEAQLARPAVPGPYPAVLLLQEGLGVTQHLLRLARRFADAGYLTLVPNLYSREPAHKQPTEQEVLPFPDVLAAVQYLKRHALVRPDAIASVGFSLGGGLSAELAASGAGLAAGVIYYGQGPKLDQLGKISHPLLGHYAENDPAITPYVRALHAQLKAAGKRFEAFIYAGTDHGFFSDSRPVYKRDAAELAHTRTLEFLGKQLARTTPLPHEKAALAW